MKTNTTTETLSTDNRIFLNGKQLAEVLDVSPPSLSEAVKKGYNCGGYPVGEWAIVSDSGRIKGYDVPEFLVSCNHQKSEKRPNPEQNVPNEVNISPNKGQKPANQAQNITHNYSLLPEGEDYVRPVGMATLPLVIKKALEQDTPQSRAVITGGLTGIGAIIGHAITESSGGAGIGAVAGLGIAYFAYKYFNPYNNLSQQPALQQELVRQKLLNAANKANQSGFLAN
ncbi:hypothetical protein NC796_02075 [Aliifodinibius sp. S!AR15-10]|uniref:hypothetical protein n=1 Tax=Aliifodinibius sp. S!AR15-10 TaxID=2950437 RepID=UPI00285AC16C|nr:hypothetical protein [Aliifodinibius sp. S!AR15-10]MDR8389907.1 hypothetical protein [Aliifodinibius sp. S!AR15-10]